MRPQQQNRRMRGRNNNPNSGNNNRKGPNPLTRNYESNGPDVKIRGSAQQIADKYAQLARDAQSSGDRVMAENYLQHAEHYNRIIAAAQAQMPIQQQTQNQRDDADDDGDEDRDEFENQGNPNRDQNRDHQHRDNANRENAGNGSREHSGREQGDREQAVNPGTGPQPVIEGLPAEVALNSEPGGEGGSRHNRGHGHGPNGVNGADGEGSTRRPRRPRRGRPERDATANGSGDAVSGDDAPQPAAADQAATELAPADD